MLIYFVLFHKPVHLTPIICLALNIDLYRTVLDVLANLGRKMCVMVLSDLLWLFSAHFVAGYDNVKC